MQAISEELPFSDDEAALTPHGRNQCPSQSRVQAILSENDFKNASEIAEDYQKYVQQEEYDKESLMEDLRDPDGSYVADSELKTIYHWTDQQAVKFKHLVQKLMVEKDKEIQIRHKHKSLMQSLMKKTQSAMFVTAVEKSVKQEQEQSECDPQSAMPTYINRAIWFRSDDENLERLVDRAVKEVVQLDAVWSDKGFVENIYSDDKFSLSVEEIFRLKFHFFDRFVEERYKRQLQLNALIDEGEKTHLKTPTEDKEEKEAKGDYNYIAYYIKKDLKPQKEEKKEEMGGIIHEEEEVEDRTQHPDDKERDNNVYEYHLYPASMREQIDAWMKDKENPRDLHEICKLHIEEGEGYEWAWWRRKTKGDVARIAKANGTQTYGFWDILNNDKSKTQNINFNGVRIDHLNIIFALLRHYYAYSIKMKGVAAKKESIAKQNNKTILIELEDMQRKDPTMLNVTYCQGVFVPIKFEVDIFIHDESEGKSLYELTWWNGKKRTDCNAIAIKNKTAMLDKDAGDKVKPKEIKEKYYMRLCTQDVADPDMGIDWLWYDNDGASFEGFKDYIKIHGADHRHKDMLLHKQLEAIFQSNIDTNYPWKYFDRYDDKVPKHCHSFNSAQITHLRPALEENGLRFNTCGYLVRFVRLHAPKNVNSEFDLNIILDMEQIAITKEETTFSRNIRRMKNGKNSLSLVYAGSNVFITHWLQNYLLSSKAQRQYFWSFILCIAAKIKQIDIEIENQLVTIPQYEAFLSATKKDALAFDEGEVRDEQNDVVLYPGFLVPPILDGEAATDQTGALSKNTVQGFKKKINNLSKTRIFRKALVREQALKMRKDEENDKFVWYQSSDGEQYRNSLGVMFRFGEIIRKFILEKKHLADDTSLWPYYKNYFHRNDHQSYHTLINRFNLSLMFSRGDMFELLEQEAIQDKNANAGCFSHFSCAEYNPKENEQYDESERMKSKEVAIRHQRKVAAQLLLQTWDSLRNLNILRHQLGPLLKVVMEDAKVEEEEYDETTQKRLIDIAKEYNQAKWNNLIQITNNRLKDNLHNIETGWQLLTDYDIHRVDSMEISIPQYPFFESFMKHFLLQTIVKEREDVERDLNTIGDRETWYPLFRQSWTITPEWWIPNHDIVLMELALKHGDEWHKYGQELQGDNASNYMMRLRAIEEEEEHNKGHKSSKSKPYVHGHTLRISNKDLSDIKSSEEEIQDDLRPYLEFQHWCRQKSNMLHRLKYITNTLMHNLIGIQPSLVEIRIPHHDDQPKFNSQSHIFSEYERNKHLEYVQRESKLPKVDNYTTEWTLNAMKGVRGGESREVLRKRTRALSTESLRRNKMREQAATGIEIGLTGLTKMITETYSPPQANLPPPGEMIEKKKTVSFASDAEVKERDPVPPPLGDRKESSAIERYQTDLSEPDEEEETFDHDDNDDDVRSEQGRAGDEDKSAWSDEDVTEIRFHDPFIHRNYLSELEEVIHAFNMIKYGPYMARFIINEIREYNMPELWDALAVIMEAMPFPMGLRILKEQMRHLRRSKPEQLFKVCKEMVDGTNFGVAAALRMAQYFRKVAKTDSFQEKTWQKKSIEFEGKAHELINDIESDHLLYILMTIPLYDTSESMSILSLALEEKRVSFLNNDRILGIMKHVWYHSAAIHVEEDIEPRDFGWGESLQILFFQPFKFYMSPVGFNWTIAIFYVIYLLFVMSWSYFVIKGRDPDEIWLVFWLCNAGFVGYELSEFADKGRQYFSVTGIMNVWDIVISVIWVALFLLFTLEKARQRFFIDIELEHDMLTSTTTTNAPFNNDDLFGNMTTTTAILASLSTFFTSDFDAMEEEEKSPSEFINHFSGKTRQIFSFLWAIQLFFVSTRFLTLFQNTKYLGSLLKIVQKMFTEIVKFFSVAIVVVAAYTFGFYFIFGFNLVNINGEENDPAQDFWPTVLFTFDEFIAGGTKDYTDNHVVPFFAIFITVIGFLVLTNMLIALMSTEYEAFQESATLEIAYMWTETCYDLAHRDRLMPPPLNLIAYAIGLLLHIVFVLPCAICCGTSDWNLYTHFSYNTYTWLNACYCGCNKAHRESIHDSIPSDDDGMDKHKETFVAQSKKIYQDRFTTFLSFSGWMFFRDCCLLSCCKKRIFCCCSAYCDNCCVPKDMNKNQNTTKSSLSKSKSKSLKLKEKVNYCYKPKKCFRKCCCNDYDDEAASLTAYHKGCYNCIKLRVKDSVTGQDTTTIRGISMKQYIERFETKHRTKLHKEDKILLKHLTVDTLFCDHCYQPYLEKDVKEVLLSPFRVLLDFISCFVFLITAWLPLVIFFSVMSTVEYFMDNANKSIQAETDTEGSNEYDQFDREFFPHPLSQIVEK